MWSRRKLFNGKISLGKFVVEKKASGRIHHDNIGSDSLVIAA